MFIFALLWAIYKSAFIFVFLIKFLFIFSFNNVFLGLFLNFWFDFLDFGLAIFFGGIIIFSKNFLICLNYLSLMIIYFLKQTVLFLLLFVEFSNPFFGDFAIFLALLLIFHHFYYFLVFGVFNNIF